MSELKKKYKVFIQGPNVHPYAKMFLSRGDFMGVRDIEQSDIVVFTGGADVDPTMYGEKPIPNTFFDEERDGLDVQAFCDAEERLKVGICRGAQFLNIMSGGLLWQDVDNHRKPHHIIDVTTNHPIFVTSTHHQQMIPGPRAVLWAQCHMSDKKRSYMKSWSGPRKTASDPYSADPEVVWYPSTQSLCFQPHPEFDGFTQCRRYFFDCLKRAMQALEGMKV